MTIPRMELSAAVLATRLDRMIEQEVTLPIDQSTFWTDSSCVLKARIKGFRPLLQIESQLFLTSPPQHNGGMLTLFRIPPMKHQGDDS